MGFEIEEQTVDDLVHRAFELVDSDAQLTTFTLLMEGIDCHGERVVYMSTNDGG